MYRITSRGRTGKVILLVNMIYESCFNSLPLFATFRFGATNDLVTNVYESEHHVEIFSLLMLHFIPFEKYTIQHKSDRKAAQHFLEDETLMIWRKREH